jgi:hypothetical protein
LLSIGLDALMVETLKSILNAGELKAERLEWIEKLLDERLAHPALPQGMQGDRVGIIEICDLLRRGGITVNSIAVPTPQGRKAANKAASWVFGGWLAFNQAKCMELLAQVMDVLDDPRVARDTVAAMEDELSHLSAMYTVVKVVMPSYARAITLSHRAWAEMASARVALAAERYRMDHGQWPAQLDDLVPQYMETVPHDPFADGPLSYMVAEDGITIYTVSENEVDDHGDIDDAPDEEGSPPDSGFRLLNPEQRGFRVVPE